MTTTSDSRLIRLAQHLASLGEGAAFVWADVARQIGLDPKKDDRRRRELAHFGWELLSTKHAPVPPGSYVITKIGQTEWHDSDRRTPPNYMQARDLDLEDLAPDERQRLIELIRTGPVSDRAADYHAKYLRMPPAQQQKVKAALFDLILNDKDAT